MSKNSTFGRKDLDVQGPPLTEKEFEAGFYAGLPEGDHTVDPKLERVLLTKERDRALAESERLDNAPVMRLKRVMSVLGQTPKRMYEDWKETAPVAAPSFREGAHRALKNVTKLLEDMSGKNGTDAALNAISNTGIGAMAIGKVGANAAERTLLSTAQNMAKGNIHADEILNKTGWWRGLDGKWRMEISDRGTSMRVRAQNLDDTPTKLYEAVNHVDIFDRYPQLKRLLAKREPPLTRQSGTFDPKTREVTIGSTTKFEEEDIALHEIQHAVQNLERFAEGTNVAKEGGSRLSYLANQGEIEARLTEIRRNWTDAMRKKYPMKEHFLDEIKRLQDANTAYPNVGELMQAANKARGFPSK